MGVVIIVIIVLLFAFIVYSNEKRKAKEGKKTEKPKPEKAKKEKPEKVKKEKVKKVKTKKEKALDTDDIPNFENLTLSNGELEDILTSENPEAKAKETKLDEAFMKEQLDEIFNAGSSPSVFREDSKWASEKPPMREVLSNQAERKSSTSTNYNSTLQPSSEEVEEWAKYVLNNNDGNSLADKIKNLPPEIKAMIVTNILERKDY